MNPERQRACRKLDLRHHTLFGCGAHAGNAWPAALAARSQASVVAKSSGVTLAKPARQTGSASAATKAGIGATPVESSTPMPADEQMPMGIERADTDLAGDHRLEDAPRSDEIADRLAIDPRPLSAAIAQQMMAQGVEAGMRMLDRPTDSAREAIFQAAVRRIRTHGQIGAIDRAALRPLHGGDQRRKWHDLGQTQCDRIAAHQHRAAITARPDLFERLRGGIGQVGQRDSISAASKLSSLPYRSMNAIIESPG